VPRRPTIWLTGSGGFIGSPLARLLKQNETDIKCLSNSAGDSGVARKREHECIHLDFLNKPAIEQLVRDSGLPDVFMHVGWGAMADPESSIHLEENVQAGKILIQTLFELGLSKFIFLGSMNEYGARVGSLSENMKAEGRLTNYAKAKIQVAEFGFETARRLKRIFIHIRPFYVFGAGQKSGSLINTLYESYRNDGDANLGPCEHYRDYIHVSDVVEGMRRLSDINVSATVNLGSGTVIKLKDFVTLFWDCLGGDREKLKFGFYEMRAGDPEQPQSFADLLRLKKLTNWVPSRSLKDGIELTIRDLAQN